MAAGTVAPDSQFWPSGRMSIASARSAGLQDPPVSTAETGMPQRQTIKQHNGAKSSSGTGSVSGAEDVLFICYCRVGKRCCAK